MNADIMRLFEVVFQMLDTMYFSFGAVSVPCSTLRPHIGSHTGAVPIILRSHAEGRVGFSATPKEADGVVHVCVSDSVEPPRDQPLRILKGR
jgi:hypothetical protein